MTTAFPSGIDALSNPSSTDATNSVSVPHATQHANANDAIEAIETRVGIVGSADTSSLTYRIAQLEASAPTAWTDHAATLTQGATITQAAQYSKWRTVGKQAQFTLYTVLGSAGTAATAIQMLLPVAPVTGIIDGHVLGDFYLVDAGTTYYSGVVLAFPSGGTAICRFQCDNGQALGVAPAYTIASTDTLSVVVSYPIA